MPANFGWPGRNNGRLRGGAGDDGEVGVVQNNTQWDRRTLLQLAILMLIVPAQLVLTDWLGTPEFERSDLIRRFVTNAQFYYDKYCVDVKALRKAIKVWVYTQALNVDYDDGPDIQPDLTDDQNSENKNDIKSGDGLLGASLEIHSPRPSDVHFRVGQVLRHKVFKYRAVIIGWDERPRAPKGWFQGVVPEREMSKYLDQPFYSVLIDTRDRAPQTTYVPSANIELLSHSRVIHPSLDAYFEYYDGQGQYVMRPWLKNIYPHDGP